jgi:hypothetical protein
MADNDYNIIRPVEGSQSISSLKPARRREERKRRHPLGEEKREEQNDEPDEREEEESFEGNVENQHDEHKVDYRA